MRLSIIVPIYNMEKYLDDCFASLTDQDIEDYEIICVNDGSKDNSLVKIRDWEAKFPKNFVVINQENSGVSTARNAGIKAATGTYVWFVDADDYIDGNIYSTIIELMDENDLDMMSISVKNVPDNSSYTKRSIKYIINKIDKDTLAGFANKIVRRIILIDNNITWNSKMSYGEDVLFQFHIRLATAKIGQIDGITYYYRANPNSAMQSYSKERNEKWSDSMIEMGNIYSQELEKRKDEPIASHIKVRLSLVVTGLMFHYAISLEESKIKEKIIDLRKRGWYPFPLLWYRLKPEHAVLTTIRQWSEFLFPFEWYYRIFYKVIKKVPSAKKFMI